MTSLHPTLVPCRWFVHLASALDRRSAPRLALLFVGAVLAGGRRTVTTWIRAAGLGERFRSCYIAVAAAGKRAERVAMRLLLEVVVPLPAGSGRLTLAIDDTPTRRYGPYVQAAGVHHNPTPGPAGSPHLYGHVFVVLALLVEHRSWGVIALPLLSRLYVRRKDLPTIDLKHRPEFRTKLVMAVELLRWARTWLGLLRRPRDRRQALQDVPGDLAARRRRDPGRPGRRADRLAGLLLHRPGRHGRRRPDHDRRPLQPGKRPTARRLKAKVEGSPGGPITIDVAALLELAAWCRERLTEPPGAISCPPTPAPPLPPAPDQAPFVVLRSEPGPSLGSTARRQEASAPRPPRQAARPASRGREPGGGRP